MGETWDITTIYCTHESIPTSIFMPFNKLKELLVIKRTRRARAREVKGEGGGERMVE